MVTVWYPVYSVGPVFHRNVLLLFQPENILLDDNLNVKLSDFGFAMVLSPNEELTGN